MKIIDINQLREEASRCFTCKVPKCKKNCPISTQIPEVISLFKENKKTKNSSNYRSDFNYNSILKPLAISSKQRME